MHLILLFQANVVLAQSRIPLEETCVSAYMSGDYITCLNEYLRFLKTHEDLNNEERLALLLRLSYIAAWENQVNVSLALLKDADELEAQGITPDSASTADRYLVQAILEYYQGRLTDASDILISSVQYRGIENDFEKAILADSYGFLGLVYSDLEDYETAIRYYNEAITIDRELGRSFVMANELKEMASCLMRIDPFDPEIEKLLDEALAIYRSLNNLSYEAYVNNEYCLLYRERNNLPRALEYILEAAKIKESIQDETLDVTYNNIGAIYENMNQTDSSIIYIYKAINTAKILKKNPRGEYFNNLGARFGKLGQLDSAMYYFEMAIQQLIPDSLAEEPDVTFYSMVNPQLPRYLANIANVHFDSFKINGSLDELRKSIESYQTALGQLDTLRFLYSFENKPHAVKENRKYYFLALQSAAEYYYITKNPDDLEEAFLLASKSKSMVFDEYLRVDDARGFLDINPDLFRRVDSLKMLKAQELQTVYANQEASEQLTDSTSKYSTRVFEIDEAINILNREIKEKNPAYYQSIHTMPAFPSDLVRSRLSDNELLIDFTWHENQLITIAIGPDEFRMHRTEVPEDLRDNLRVYRYFMEGRPNQLTYNQFKEKSYYLYQILFEPFDSLIGNRDLLIIPDDSLALIPFETLLYEVPNESSADYAKLPLLIKRNPVSYYHSVQQYIMNTEESPLSTSGVSAFAPFDKDDYSEGNYELEALKGSAEEIRAIRKHIPARLYFSGSASEEQFRHDISKSRIIHIATHGLQEDSTPLQNHLLFYPGNKKEDFKFHLFELLGMHIESPLVILSSCNTGAGTLQPGEGVLSLARAFHFAGTPALLMSQWPVDDRAATIIMDEFYAALEKGNNLNKALQLAKLSYLEKAGRAQREPYYWASFQLTGYSGPLIIDHRLRAGKILLLGAGLLALGIIILIVRLYIRKRTK